jgi:hypothetical protein
VGEEVEQGLGRLGIRDVELFFDLLDPGEVGGAVILGFFFVGVVDDGARAGAAGILTGSFGLQVSSFEKSRFLAMLGMTNGEHLRVKERVEFVVGKGGKVLGLR